MIVRVDTFEDFTDFESEEIRWEIDGPSHLHVFDASNGVDDYKNWVRLGTFSRWASVTVVDETE